MTTLGYALLGMLAREPLTGYELAQHLKAPVGFFWHARHSQIYPELANLERQGLVTHRVVEQPDRPDKKVYSIAEAGLAALKQWATEPMPVAAAREELVLKAYSLWLADPERARALFRQHEREHRERLAEYERFQEQMERECGTDLGRLTSPWFATYATLRRGIGYEREYAAWCHWVADQLERDRLPES